MEIYTIGVYHSNEQEFFDKLIKNEIDTFCDIRQRRGVRGSKYAFVNSKKLQKKLEELKIRYLYLPQLAPTTEIRNLQKDSDNKNNILKSEREELSSVFIEQYQHKVINNFDFKQFLEKLQEFNAQRIVFFCVEAHPKACHRSIITDFLNQNFQLKIFHL